MKNNDRNNLMKMLLILAAATALRVAHRPQPNTMITRLLNLPTATTKVVQQETTMDATEKAAFVQNKVDEILNDLGIENLQNQPIDIQKQAAYRILKHILAATTNLYNSKDADTSALNSIYQTLSAGNNINSLTSESMAICLLYQQAGLTSKCVTIQKQPQHVHDVLLERDILAVEFKDNNHTELCLCDPIHTKIAGKNTKASNDLSGVFMSPDIYFGKYYKDYQKVAEYNPADDLAIETAETTTATTQSTDFGMER